ncbi:MAG TPA: phosphoenolpyruvate carboxykinase (ATP) [Devosiaceae bacterium]|jgi:phosphoenolpyruvate carboxykinase (ATP)
MPSFDHAALRKTITAGAASLSANDPAPVLVAKALRQNEGVLTADGALSVTTGKYTGRSPKDKFIVRDANTEDTVWWDNTNAMSPAQFDVLLADVTDFMKDRDLLAQDLLAGADPRQQRRVTVFTERGWHALFIRNLLIRPEAGAEVGTADVTILHAPDFKADPKRHGTLTDTVIALDVSRNLVIIGGTFYAGEIKKSVFSLFNFHAPHENVLPMHCSANVGKAGDVALFFGLSGTGKTTLSTDPDRLLIGDDEHGWTEDGIFNLEGGCYAKTVKLSAEAEPEIYAASRSFGTVLENLVLDEKTLLPLFDDISLTENTRAAYPLETLPAVSPGSTGGVPKTVVFLTADAFGVLPPIARLTPEQAVYHFLSGYTAKVAGTERGVTEPQATFSTCFGAPFMSLHPTVYGDLLAKRLKASGATIWLLNTGWTGGAYGTGKRIDIASTRRLLNAALSGELDRGPTRLDPIFGLAVPAHVSGIDDTLLEPRRTWGDVAAYDRTAEKLVALFSKNFEKFSDHTSAAFGPKLAVAAE